MVFHLIARNQDDHVQNIAFLMDRNGTWRLSPALDVTWAYNPAGDWTACHQMSVNGRRDDFTREDLLACGRNAGLKPGRILDVLEEVRAAVAKWPDVAEAAKVNPGWIVQIGRALRLDL